jgi:hypothetical protein
VRVTEFNVFEETTYFPRPKKACNSQGKEASYNDELRESAGHGLCDA